MHHVQNLWKIKVHLLGIHTLNIKINWWDKMWARNRLGDHRKLIYDKTRHVTERGVCCWDPSSLIGKNGRGPFLSLLQKSFQADSGPSTFQESQHFKEIMFCFLKNICWLIRERGREGEREAEKNPCERETLISSFSFVPQPGTEPTSQACVWTGNRTNNLLLCGMAPNQLSHTSQGRRWYLSLWLVIKREVLKWNMEKYRL